MSPRPAVAGAIVATVGLLLTAAPAAQSQGLESWAALTGFTVTRYPNAVRVSVEADGAVALRGASDFEGGSTRRHSIVLSNARTQLGNFLFVGVYPISHLEIEPTPEATVTGTGIRVTIVTYVAGSFFGVLDAREVPVIFGQPFGPTVYVNQRADQRGFIATALSDQFVPPQPQPLSDAERAALTTRLEVSGDRERVRVLAMNADLADVIEAIHRASGLSVAVEAGVPDRVSVFLPAVAPHQAVALLAERLGLSLAVREHELVLGPPEVLEASGYAVSTTLAVPLRYLTATRALTLLPTVVLPYLRADEEQNAVVVHAPRTLAEKVASDLAVLDQPSPIVELRALLIETTREVNLLAALKVEGARGVLDPDFGELLYRNLPEDPDLPALEARLRALAETEQVRIAHAAVIRVQSGSGASVFQGAQQFITVVTFGSARTLRVDAGVSLGTHVLGAGERIGLGYELTANSIVSLDPIDRTPTVAIRRSNGFLWLQPGETAVIAGMERLQPVTVHRGIPLLRDLPLIGGLFGSVRRRFESSELTILLTASRLAPAPAPSEGAR